MTDDGLVLTEELFEKAIKQMDEDFNYYYSEAGQAEQRDYITKKMEVKKKIMELFEHGEITKEEAWKGMLRIEGFDPQNFNDTFFKTLTEQK